MINMNKKMNIKKNSKNNAQRKSNDKPGEKNPGLLVDIIGIIFITIAPLLILILFTPENSGIVGKVIDKGLLFLFGQAAFVFPLFLIYYGLFLIFKGKRFLHNKSIIGVTTLLLSICAISSLIITSKNGNDNSSIGIIGNSITHLFQQCFGIVTGFILAVMVFISVLLIIDISVKDVILCFKNTTLYLFRICETNIKKQKNETDSSNILSNKKPKEAKKIPVIKEKKITDIIDTNNLLPDNIELKEPKNKKNKPDGDFEFSETPKDLNGYQFPPTDILKEISRNSVKTEKELQENINIIVNTLRNFNVETEVEAISCGPTVARYEIKLADGIKVNKITNLADNLAMSLAAIDVRIEAPIPGKSAIGVEVPNKNRTIVGLREILEDDTFKNSKYILPFVIGKDVAGAPVLADLTKMPHLLIGGATNSGKSVGLNTLIASLLYKLTPNELRLVLIDPKRVELSLYDGIPHLACPVVKDAKLAAGALRCVINEMDKRYRKLESIGSKNIVSYNAKVDEDEKLPYMVIVIDELSDLMMQCAKEVEDSICRIAQLSRAVGIHLVIATQRPSVDVITGKIKANIASRIAFAVTSHIDSRTIIDTKGAERLIGYGDMLFHPIDSNKPLRVQGCYLSEDEIEKICNHLKKQQEPIYEFQPQVLENEETTDIDDDSYDELWDAAIKITLESRYCSTSTLQRKFKIGYNRAARIVDQMEKIGIVGPLNGAKPREILITEEQLPHYLLANISNKNETDYTSNNTEYNYTDIDIEEDKKPKSEYTD